MEKKSILFFFLFFVTCFIHGTSWDDEKSAPFSQAFKDYQNSTVSERNNFYVPHPVSSDHLFHQKPKGGILKAASLPKTFDLRTLNRVTPVKNQGKCGACWAFTAMAGLESSFMPDIEYDFSENNLKNLNGFDLSPCIGGNGSMSGSYFMRWDGPVLEETDPYDVTNLNSKTFPAVVHIQDFYKVTSSDINLTKEILIKYGAVFSSLEIGKRTYTPCQSAYCNDEYFAFYNPDADPTGKSANHSVAIVGWDDNFSKSKFVDTPQNDGAWIAKNSYGPSWGLEGYFYISYEDPVVNKEAFVFPKPDPDKKYSNQYSYDPLGMIGSTGFNEDTAWFANVFTAKSSEQLRAVSFYAHAHNSSYVVRVYKNILDAKPFVQGLDEVVSTVEGTLELSGYNTVNLKTPVDLKEGDVFSVAVRLTTPDWNYPVPFEYAVSNYSSKATAEAGQSYFTYDSGGNPAKWSDATEKSKSHNVCLKAYTVSYIDFKVEKEGAGSGNISGSGIDCGDVCEISIFEFSPVKLTATPDENSQFYGWKGDCTGEGECELIVSKTTKLTAFFGCIDGTIQAVGEPCGIDGDGDSYKECEKGEWVEKCDESAGDKGSSSGCSSVLI